MFIFECLQMPANVSHYNWRKTAERIFLRFRKPGKVWPAISFKSFGSFWNLSLFFRILSFGSSLFRILSFSPSSPLVFLSPLVLNLYHSVASSFAHIKYLAISSPYRTCRITVQAHTPQWRLFYHTKKCCHSWPHSSCDWQSVAAGLTLSWNVWRSSKFEASNLKL